MSTLITFLRSSRTVLRSVAPALTSLSKQRNRGSAIFSVVLSSGFRRSGSSDFHVSALDWSCRIHIGLVSPSSTEARLTRVVAATSEADNKSSVLTACCILSRFPITSCPGKFLVVFKGLQAKTQNLFPNKQKVKRRRYEEVWGQSTMPFPFLLRNRV